MNKSVRNKLFIMMVLELFIWGAWLPKIFGYLDMLHFTTAQKSWTLNAFALASFVGMFFSNQFVDRKFAAEKFMAVSHLIGGVSILALTWVQSFPLFFTLMLIHCLFYVPTLSIANSIAFSHLKDAQKEFGQVRMGGTVGWIAASWPLFFILQGKSGPALQQGIAWTFALAGIASLALAAFSLTLPHTPPKPANPGAKNLAWLEAMSLLKVPAILILFLVTFVDACVHQCYFIWTDSFLTKQVGFEDKWVMPIMSIGQVAEVGTMAVLGFFLKRLGWRKTMTLGILGHTVRFGIFALLPNSPTLIVAINVLHGVCYAFFFATVYIFVDEYFPKDIRTSAQGLFNFLIFGLGPFVGNIIWPKMGDIFKVNGDATDWKMLFLAPAGTALVAAILFFILFHPKEKVQTKVGGQAVPAH